MIDLNDIALFVQVVRGGSFAEAARRLGVPSNTVSRRVQLLEAQLGMRLLQRSTRKLTLTSAGEAFHEHCAGPVEGLTDAATELMTGTQEPRGLVRVAVPADFFDFFPMEWVADFLLTRPRVRFDFVLNDAKTDLISERIDVAFRGGQMQDSGYIGHQVLRDGHDGLVASPAYIATCGTPGTLQDLANHDCVSFALPGRHITWRMAGPDGIDEEVQLIPRFSANTAQALRKATLAGLGVTLLPQPVIKHDLNAGLLVPVLPQYKRTSHGLHVLYPSRQHLPLAVSAFIDLVVEKLRELQTVR